MNNFRKSSDENLNAHISYVQKNDSNIEKSIPNLYNYLLSAIHRSNLTDVLFILPQISMSDLESGDENGCTPLHLAIRRDSLEGAPIVKAIAQVSPQAVFAIYDDFGFTPLHWAARSRNSQIISVIASKIEPNAYLKGDLNTGQTPLHFAILQRDYPSVLELMKGAPKRAYIVIDNCQLTLMHCAAVSNNKEIAFAISNMTPDLIFKSTDKYKRTPIHYASIMYQSEIFNMILERTSKDILQVGDMDECTSVHLCAQFADINALKAMHNLVPSEIYNRTDNSGHTPLHLAARTGDVEMIEFLCSLTSHKVYEMQGKNNFTPLGCAINFLRFPNINETNAWRAIELILDTGLHAISTSQINGILAEPLFIQLRINLSQLLSSESLNIRIDNLIEKTGNDFVLLFCKSEFSHCLNSFEKKRLCNLIEKIVKSSKECDFERKQQILGALRSSDENNLLKETRNILQEQRGIYLTFITSRKIQNILPNELSFEISKMATKQDIMGINFDIAFAIKKVIDKKSEIINFAPKNTKLKIENQKKLLQNLNLRIEKSDKHVVM